MENGRILGVASHRHFPIQSRKPQRSLADAHARLDGHMEPASDEQRQIANLALRGRSAHISRKNLLARDIRHRGSRENLHLVGERSGIAQLNQIAERFLRAADGGTKMPGLFRVRHQSELVFLTRRVRGEDTPLRRDDPPGTHIDLQVFSDADILRARHAQDMGPAGKRHVEKHGPLEKDNPGFAAEIQERARRDKDARASQQDAPEPRGFHHVSEIERIGQQRGLNQQRPHQR